MFEEMQYAGLGLYIGLWQTYAGDEGNLRRDEVQYADTPEPERFVGTYATYIEMGRVKQPT